MVLSMSAKLAAACCLASALLLSCSSPEKEHKNLPEQGSLASLIEAWTLPTPPRSQFVPRFRKILSSPLIGTGDRVGHDRGDSVVFTHEFAWARKAPLNSVAIWLPRGWENEWVHKEDIARLHRDGVTPVFLLYFFGSENSTMDARRLRWDWYEYLARVASYVAGRQPVMLVIEPEINDEGAYEKGGTPMMYWPELQEMLIEGIYVLRALAPNAMVGLCFGDFGDQPLEANFGEAVAYTDFVAFQEMRASTRNPAEDPSGFALFRQALDTTGRLHRAFDKPVILAYLAVSTWGQDNATGWQMVQAGAIRSFMQGFPELQQEGLTGLLYFQLFDDPAHQGYFMEAEKHFGLMDENGEPKPAWWIFQQGVTEIMAKTPGHDDGAPHTGGISGSVPAAQISE